MEQISIFEIKGVRSHWYWTGLYYKMCVMCNYLDDHKVPPEVCPGCGAVMIQPEPRRRRGGRQ